MDVYSIYTYMNACSINLISCTELHLTYRYMSIQLRCVPSYSLVDIFQKLINFLHVTYVYMFHICLCLTICAICMYEAHMFHTHVYAHICHIHVHAHMTDVHVHMADSFSICHICIATSIFACEG